MDVAVDRSTLPRWGWLLLGLFAASLLGQALNFTVLFQFGLPESYGIVTVIALMSPVLIYVGVWYDEDRRHYWERSRAWIAGDLVFVVAGTVMGASITLLGIESVPIGGILRDVTAMIAGFITGWALFWWRNPDLYRRE